MHDDGLIELPRASDRCILSRNEGGAADGQMGCLIKLYRDWQLSGDEAMIRKLWPNARKALEFCLAAGRLGR